MNSPETSDKCQKYMDSLINGQGRQTADSELREHLAVCPACAQLCANLELLHKEESAFSNESHPELKLKIMRRLEPALAKRREVGGGISTLLPSWLWQMSFAMVVVLVAWYSLFNGQQTLVSPPQIDQIMTAAAPGSFIISVNGGAQTQSSMDNPVSLFVNETAAITAPDGSNLKVTGPARLNVMPRGFHLLQGRLEADVARGKGEFVGTTPHGQITVLGTVFICETDNRKTTVEVVSGKVLVKPDGQAVQFLSAGEKTEMYQSGSVSTETETIPAIDSE